MEDGRLEYKIALLNAAIARFKEGKEATGGQFTETYWSLIDEIALEFNRRKSPPEIGDTMWFTDSKPAKGIRYGLKFQQADTN